MRRDGAQLIRKIPGRKLPIGRAMAGPIGLLPTCLAQEYRNVQPVVFTTMGSEYDNLIAEVFERIRSGLSVDAFLADPKLSRDLAAGVRASGVRASQFQIAMRLFALRKQASDLISKTSRQTRTRDLLSKYGPGTEAAMLRTTARFGASVDDMVAHPQVGREFVRLAKKISPGGTAKEYRLSALQIRKSRNLSHSDQQQTEKLHASELDLRWTELGSPGKLSGVSAHARYGLAELTDRGEPLFVLRTRRLAEVIETAFSPTVVDRMLAESWFSEAPTDLSVRYVANQDLPHSVAARPWELVILRDQQPPLNWPILKQAA